VPLRCNTPSGLLPIGHRQKPKVASPFASLASCPFAFCSYLNKNKKKNATGNSQQAIGNSNRQQLVLKSNAQVRIRTAGHSQKAQVPVPSTCKSKNKCNSNY